MPKVSFGPIDVRYFSGLNWSNLEVAWVTARKQGLAQRETTLRSSFKSEHLLDITGIENHDDTITVNGTTYFGRCSQGSDGVQHTLSSAQVAARAQRINAMRQGLTEANRAAVAITGDIHILASHS